MRRDACFSILTPVLSFVLPSTSPYDQPRWTSILSPPNFSVLHHINMSSQTRPHTVLNFLEAQAGATSHPAPESSDKQPRRSNYSSFSTPLESPTGKSSKKRRRSPEDDELPTSNVGLLSPKQAGIGGRTTLETRNELPWESHEKIIDLNFDGAVTVAQRRAPHAGLVAIRVFRSADAEKALCRHQHIKHDHIISVLDAFTTEASLYIVLEHLPISLEQIVEGAKYPTELQLAAILKQVLSGLVYLEGEGFEHGSLKCSSILLSTQGNIKIANQQCCESVRGGGEPRDVRALSPIMMELMQKYVKDDGAIGVDNLARWPSDCDAVSFLSHTTSAMSARELQNHGLMRRRTREADLMGLIFSAEVSARRDYSCTA